MILTSGDLTRLCHTSSVALSAILAGQVHAACALSQLCLIAAESAHLACWDIFGRGLCIIDAAILVLLAVWAALGPVHCLQHPAAALLHLPDDVLPHACSTMSTLQQDPLSIKSRPIFSDKQKGLRVGPWPLVPHIEDAETTT